MPRSSAVDAMDKFRFIVFVFRDLSFQNPAEELASKAPPIFTRGGFSNVTLPQQNTRVMRYKSTETHNFQYYPGLTETGPIILSRGATFQNDFYRWSTQVHDFSQQMYGTIFGRAGDPNITRKDTLFRRTLIIINTGRKVSANTEGENAKRAASMAIGGGLGGLVSGNTLIQLAMGTILQIASQENFLVDRAWIVNDAFPISYRSGDGLSATESDVKLIESIEVQYESFAEIF